MEEWTSPDDKIFKKLVLPGKGGSKPYEGSIVKLNILECSEILEPFHNKTLTIGDNDGELGRMLDICITTMHLNERAKFTITVDLEQIVAVIELVEFEFNGFIFEWDAKKKYELTLMHKEKGTKLFDKKDHVEAAYRFNKALKILSSIPLDVECPPKTVDGIKVSEIKALKEKLYNNLSSCYFREKIYNMVIPLCIKVLEYNPENVKALYKIGVAYEADKDFEKAHEALSKAIIYDPENKACAEHLANVKTNLIQANLRVNDMMKKMIIGSINN